MGAYEARRDITLSTAGVPDRQPIGTLVGTLSTVDTGVGGTFTYTRRLLWMNGPWATR